MFTKSINEYIIVNAEWIEREKFMKNRKKIKYTNEPMGKIKIIGDFLPSPDELTLKKNRQGNLIVKQRKRRL